MTTKSGGQDLPVPTDDDHGEARPLPFRNCANGAIAWATPQEQSAEIVRRMLGVDDTGTLAIRLITQAVGAMSPLQGGARTAAEANDAAQLLEDIAPQDAVEGMLALQMVATHNLAMRCLASASQTEQSFQGQEASINRATKLMRTYTAQIEALNKHRNKAKQTVVVKHVHVHEGGQAIVGNVAPGEGGGGRS